MPRVITSDKRPTVLYRESTPVSVKGTEHTDAIGRNNIVLYINANHYIIANRTRSLNEKERRRTI